MTDSIQNEYLKLDDTVKVNKEGRPILGILEGPCADFINHTRNNRKYSEKLWEKVFNDPIIKEYFECGGIPGELDHPTDRSETCSEKIAIMMPEPPKKNKQGQLIARFDILDTPNGRIAHTLAKYGYKLGISSRGDGETYIDDTGEESVDEDTYALQAFDLVLLPAVKKARLNLVSESFDTKDESFRVALAEAFARSNNDEKRVMVETLKNLNIDYSIKKRSSNINRNSENFTADNDGVKVLKELQSTVKENKALQSRLANLQEKLSVCYAKETKYEELNAKYNSMIKSLSESTKISNALKKRISLMTEQLKEKTSKNTHLVESIKNLRKCVREVKSTENAKEQLNETLSKKNTQIKKLLTDVESLTESVQRVKAEAERERQSLIESLEELKKDSMLMKTDYSNKVEKAKQIAEKYKTIAKTAVDKYISNQAIRIGASTEEIKNRLPENYSFNDIDSVCEELQSYKINMSRLPFNLNLTSDKKVKMKVSESYEPIVPKTNLDDEIDESLRNLAGI